MYLSHPHFSLLAFPHNCVTYDPNIVWLSAEIKCKYQLRFGFWWCRNHSLGVAFANPSNLSARPWDVLVWWVANCTARLHTHLASQPQDADQTVTWIKLSARLLDVLVWSAHSTASTPILRLSRKMLTICWQYGDQTVTWINLFGRPRCTCLVCGQRTVQQAFTPILCSQTSPGRPNFLQPKLVAGEQAAILVYHLQSSLAAYQI